jgi:hypothetical protein
MWVEFGGINCDCFGILFCGDMDFMGVSYYCLWSYMCCYLLCCECSVDIGEYYVVVVVVIIYGHVLLCTCNFICKLENIGER